MKIDKSRLKDVMGRPMTQSLFLEVNYDKDTAVYTMKDEDYEYEGKVYPSLKRLYLEACDPTEYQFAITYLCGWDHWKRITNNKLFKNMVDKWRDELEVKMVSDMVGCALGMAFDENKPNMVAVKYITGKEWCKRGAGRPTKQDVEKELKIRAAIEDEYGADIARMENYR